MRVLVVEDEQRMASVIRSSLVKEGLAADVAQRGEDALWMARAVDYDAIVLDLMLPGLSGFETCRRMRASGVWSPVLMLTARDAVADRVEGLDSGADDYLVKPFALAELHARLRALARRGRRERPVVLSVGELTLDPARRLVRRRGADVALSAKEFAVLEALLCAAPAFLSAESLLEQAWDEHADPFTNTVTVTIGRLRRKLGDPPVIATTPGVGYRIAGQRGLGQNG